MKYKSPTETDIAIVGAGPAGAYLAYLLSKEGLKPVIFDDSHPREKPCGGGISSFALRKFPLLQEIRHMGDSGIDLKIVSPKGNEAIIRGRKECLSVSREILDQFLLIKAKTQGAVLVERRVVGIEKAQNGFVVKTKDSKTVCKILIGADGVNSLVRKEMVGPIDKTNLCLVMGYFGFCPQSYLEIFKYYHEFPGYAYLFKRKTDCSLGIGTRLTGADTAAMKEHLERFIKRYYPEVKLKTFWSALVPVISNPSFFDLPCCGKNWALIGDAAGHVDPITAEGILYAMWDAELLADAITAGNMAGFDSMWRKEFGHELRHKAKDAEKSYDAKSIERYVWLAKRSRTFGRIMYEYMMHEIPSKRLYATVTWRFPRIIGDIITKNGDKK